MFQGLFTHLASNPTSELLMWRWANEHPYLFTIIKVAEPQLFVIIAVAGYNLISKLMFRK
jgi:hypothetical protein